MKKKLIELSPFIAVAIVIVILFTISLANIFDEPEEQMITSATLQKVVKTADLTTTKYIQNGIAKVNLSGRYTGFVMYYATVRLNVDFSKITYNVDDENMTVTPVYPAFSFDVALDTDYSKMRFYPNDDITAKEVLTICEDHAIKEARENEELMAIAKTSLEDTIEILLRPFLDAKGYSFIRIF